MKYHRQRVLTRKQIGHSTAPLYTWASGLAGSFNALGRLDLVEPGEVGDGSIRVTESAESGSEGSFLAARIWSSSQESS